MKSVGKYREIYQSNSLPSLINIISETPAWYKDKVLMYLKSYKPSAVSPKIIVDLFTEKRINMELTCCNDGLYVWRSDVVYYFEKYNLTLEKEFLDYVLNKLK